MADGSSLEALQARHGPRFKWLVLVTLMIGTMASILASTIVNVAIPDLSRQFGLRQSEVQWVASGFMVAVTVSMLLTPWLLQRFGLRRTYSGALIALSVGAVLGGLAQHYWLVISMRVVEGLAAGVLQPIPAVMIMRTFAENERGRAMGIYGFGVVFAPAIGPSVGGVLVEAFGWRSIFFVMLPFAAAGLVLARRFLPRRVGPGERVPVDWLGLLLIAAATLCLLNGLTQLRGGDASLGYRLLWIALAAFAGFLFVERRIAAPLMQLRLFRSPTFAAGALVSLIYGMGIFGSTYLIPVWLQTALGYGPARAGLVMLPAGLTMAFALMLTGRLADRLPKHWMVSGGLATLSFSFLLLATVGLGTPYLLLVAWVVVGRIGMSFILPSLSLGALRGLGSDLIAQGSSTMGYTRQLGGAIGVSLSAIALDWRLAAHGQAFSGEAGDPLARIAAFDETFLGLAAVCAVAAAVGWRMRPRPGEGHPAP
ncbi:MAG: DHA2 family efflux MFS transporter permease subunit [Gammaproteobacteria bacterium]